MNWYENIYFVHILINRNSKFVWVFIVLRKRSGQNNRSANKIRPMNVVQCPTTTIVHWIWRCDWWLFFCFESNMKSISKRFKAKFMGRCLFIVEWFHQKFDHGRSVWLMISDQETRFLLVPSCLSIGSHLFEWNKRKKLFQFRILFIYSFLFVVHGFKHAIVSYSNGKNIDP